MVDEQLRRMRRRHLVHARAHAGVRREVDGLAPQVLGIEHVHVRVLRARLVARVYEAPAVRRPLERRGARAILAHLARLVVAHEQRRAEERGTHPREPATVGRKLIRALRRARRREFVCLDERRKLRVLERRMVGRCFAAREQR
jgi:hypothetical protein